MNKCSSAVRSLAEARKSLSNARNRYEVGLTFRRKLFRAANIFANDQNQIVADLFQEQRDMESADESGTSAARINAARIQGKIEIASAVKKLKFLKKDSVEAGKYLSDYKNSSKDRIAITKLENVLKAKAIF